MEAPLNPDTRSQMTPLMHLHILASGSKGNAAVVAGPTGSVLVDCGLSRRELHRRADLVECDLFPGFCIELFNKDHVTFSNAILLPAGKNNGMFQ